MRIISNFEIIPTRDIKSPFYVKISQNHLEIIKTQSKLETYLSIRQGYRSY